MNEGQFGKRGGDNDFIVYVRTNIELLLTSSQQLRDHLKQLAHDTTSNTDHVREKLHKIERMCDEHKGLLLGGEGMLRDDGAIPAIRSLKLRIQEMEERASKNKVEDRKATLLFWGSLFAAFCSFLSAIGPSLIKEYNKADPKAAFESPKRTKITTIRYRRIKPTVNTEQKEAPPEE